MERCPPCLGQVCCSWSMLPAWPLTVFLEDKSSLVFSGSPLKEGQVAHFNKRIFFLKKLFFFF